MILIFILYGLNYQKKLDNRKLKIKAKRENEGRENQSNNFVSEF